MFRRFVGLLCLGLAVQANAAIIDRGRTTLDTSLGYQWLDVTLTRGCGYDQLARGEFCNGINTSNWTFASSTDVAALWKNAGIDKAQGQYNGDQFDEISNLANLLGLSNSATAVQINSIAWVFDNPAGSDTARIAQLSYRPDAQIAMYVLFSATPGDYSEVGAYLFRPSAVPLPAAGWLFASALAGLIGRKWFARRHK